MARFTHDVIVIGGGAGGLVTTVGCAQLGLKTAVVERNRLGGDCLYHGCVPSKTLLRTASVYRQAQEFERFGLPPVDPPPVRMADVNRRVQGVIEEIAQHDSAERFESLGAEVFAGQPRFLSPHEVEVDGRTISARSIVIATGSSPRGLPIPGLEETGYITNLDVFSLPELPRRLVVIGAGPIGSEMAHAYARLGSEVTVLDVASQMLPREDADMAEIVQQRMEADGVTFKLGVKITSVEGSNGVKRIHLEENGEALSLDAEELLVAAGRTGNTDGLDLAKAGVAVERGFITTNSKLQTSQRHILAVGDVNGKYLFTHVAGAEGSVAVRRIALRVGGSMNYRNVPWVTYTDPELASIGYNEKAATEAGIDHHVIRQELSANDRAQAEGEPGGMMKIILDRKDRVVGTQIAGLHAGDLLLPSIFAVGKGWKLGEVMSPIYPYPTLGEIHKKTASSYMAPKLFNTRVRKILHALFRYRGIVEGHEYH
ncbi:MAG: FAD-dependent oxidoreductase [Spirochaetes bacterium]|jgi:pyruvate/2-oxoglutarate dehydrogenase complex dihydrolipoamide dehydrogenase (E3) component|nr:FAD-dependent oxidoreductase [Spirochaetota bacterium]